MGFYNSNFKLGILGGGQLGKMLISETLKFDITTKVMDSSSECPCYELANEFTVGDLMEFNDVYNFGKNVNILTIEIENVNVDALEKLENEGIKVYPSSKNIKIIQNKSLQKQFYKENNLPSSSFKIFNSKQDLLDQVNSKNCTYPFVWKSSRFGYDGKGVKIINNLSDMNNLPDIECIIENKVSIKKELSIIAVRNFDGEEQIYPTVEMEFNDANLVDFVICPATINKEQNQKAIDIALKTSRAYNHIGLLAIELFLTKNDEILINEVAPRPHNSGHHTIECCNTSQFEQHIRAILNLYLGDTSIKIPGIMLNLVGEDGFTGAVKYDGIEKVFNNKGVSVHLYGKKITKPFRKMGHITVTNNKVLSAIKIGKNIKKIIRVISK